MKSTSQTVKEKDLKKQNKNVIKYKDYYACANDK